MEAIQFFYALGSVYKINLFVKETVNKWFSFFCDHLSKTTGSSQSQHKAKGDKCSSFFFFFLASIFLMHTNHTCRCTCLQQRVLEIYRKHLREIWILLKRNQKSGFNVAERQMAPYVMLDQSLPII